MIVASACNRKAYLNKLEGTWSLSHYLYSGSDQTNTQRDTLMNKYKLVIESDNNYMESWQSLAFRADTLISNDKLSYDSTTSKYRIRQLVCPFIGTTSTPHSDNGTWQLTNSEQDLQLLDDSNNTVRIYYILKLTGSQLDLQNGKYEMDLSK